jgi:hypothetical protein
MKIGFTVTFHESPRIKEDGHEIGHKFVQELYTWCEHDFELFIIDNQSEPPFPMERYEGLSNIHCTYIEDQTKGGITGAWNLGIHQCYEAGCDLINVGNNDMYFNESLKDYLDVVLADPEIDNTLFAPTTDGTNSKHLQWDTVSRPIVQEAVGNRGYNNTLCGLMYTFTPKFYETYRNTDNEWLPLKHKNDGGDGKWGGQEGAVMIMWEHGAKMKVVRHGWFHHDKNFSYRTARKLDRGE